MNCPVCNRNSAVTLSICPGCGAMTNDSVREELKPKVSPLPGRVNFEKKGNSPVPNKLNQPLIIAAAPLKLSEPKSETTQIVSKPTMPNLVEFHTKTATIPEWRLQIQNAVRQRQGCAEVKNMDMPVMRHTKLATNGANALKAETVLEIAPIKVENSTLNSALRRIEDSRQKFLKEEPQPIVQIISPTTAAKNYPFYIASKQTEVAPRFADKNVPLSVPTKPKLAASLRTGNEPLDTNKLPPLPQAVNMSFSSVQNPAEILQAEDKIEIRPLTSEEIIETEAEISEEIDDCAPFAMRFNAGLFDLIIGSFSSMFLLAPFVVMGGNWFTFPGFFAFLATCTIIMFIYLTTAIGLFGRTVGMRLFSLEVVDIDGEEYPSLHQAAVSSSVYLLSLALGGIGFLTLPFNEEKRAVHDLVSGTIVVKEY